ncbi:MAG: hypothetical protein CL843_07960 [Crocinitomicaceae bacterium]|nr:hypothetical protein [Crocinitomicaceae bacterium]|tara:strand:- start:5155 stop:6291 length:1137 start_codon:yes stop_codon:yes gene_type:complete
MGTYVLADNIISPLGNTTRENFEALLHGKSGVKEVNSDALYPHPVFTSIFDQEQLLQYTGFLAEEPYTTLEKLFIASIKSVLDQVGTINPERTLLVVATTKGNVDLLAENATATIQSERAEIPAMTKAIADYFNLPHYITVSNACISGLSAILTARNLMESGKYDQAIVTGGDRVSEFIISGFDSFKAIADGYCKPYDKNRTGINLGEGCGTLFLSKSKPENRGLEVLAGAQSNDANHISGPSRTGKGLALAINKSIQQAGIQAKDIDLINAHGTATLYNDEMESIAMETLGLLACPLNSFKGYFGHTLGASGIIESILCMAELEQGMIVKSKGFEEQGTTRALNVAVENRKLDHPTIALKTISGFGGSNAAVLFKQS